MGVSASFMTTSEQSFELLLAGVDISSSVRFDVPELQLAADLKDGTKLQLTVRVRDVSEKEANMRADEFARELYYRLLLRFGAHIKRSEPPHVIGRTFTRDGSTSATAMPSGKALTTGPQSLVLSQHDLDDVARDVELRVITPELGTSAQLYAAVAMYATGLESQNTVVRFVVFYSALALAALFKRHNGQQQNVDRLLLDRNPQIRMSVSPRNRNVQETLLARYLALPHV